jgi:Flp pilus assembly protein TadD
MKKDMPGCHRRSGAPIGVIVPALLIACLAVCLCGECRADWEVEWNGDHGDASWRVRLSGGNYGWGDTWGYGGYWYGGYEPHSRGHRDGWHGIPGGGCWPVSYPGAYFGPYGRHYDAGWTDPLDLTAQYAGTIRRSGFGWDYDSTIADALAARRALQHGVGEKAALRDLQANISAGIGLMKTGKYEAALQTLKAAILTDENDGTAKVLYGHCLFATGRYALAAKAVRRGIEADGPPPDAVNAAAIYKDAKEFESLLAKLRQWCETFDKDADGAFLLGYMQWVAGDGKTALETLKKAVGLAPADKVAAGLLKAAMTINEKK